MCMKRTKKNRMQRYQENLLRRTKKKLLRSNLEEMSPKGKAPATAATCEGQESAAAAAG